MWGQKQQHNRNNLGQLDTVQYTPEDMDQKGEFRVWLVPQDFLGPAPSSDFLDKIHKIDCLSAEYFRQGFFFNMARDHFHTLSAEYDWEDLYLPSTQSMVSTITHLQLCDRLSLGYDAREWPEDVVGGEGYTKAISEIQNKILTHYETLCAPRREWCRKVRKWHRVGSYPQDVVDRLQQAPFMWTDLAFQDLLVSFVLNDAITLQYPLHRAEDQQFWNMINRWIERDNQEVHEGILNKVMEMLMQGQTRVFVGAAYRTFQFPRPGQAEDKKAAESSEQAMDQATQSRGMGPLEDERPEPTLTLSVSEGYENNVGLKNWPAGYRMSEYIIKHPDLFTGKRILELGSGVGLTCGVLGHARPAAMIATDYHMDVVRNLQLNLQISGYDAKLGPGCEGALASEKSSQETARALSTVEVVVDRLDWTNYLDGQLESYNADLIFTCDTVYDPEAIPALLDVCRDCLQLNPNAVCYSMQSERNPDTFVGYEASFIEHGLHGEEIPLDDVPTVFEYDHRMFHRVVLHRLTLAN